ncbi:hypothetical protein FKE98_01860 [Corynebacterium aurimucosum]|nr:hypothetical protein [Corynebacterium guaraldiae]MTE09223.1 hypothetical protein [Corynebacterium guaraldiae]PKZ25314.1 hypothetical protein CYJ44_03720 [Corynebacterium aurimucosum]TRX31838.1 hypothetical protein FNY86_11370 [Corynebacterium guaraldiae]TRX38417.1 hypothetical protein FNY89_10200 [Corynebacterium guaraldiae]
MSEPVQIESSSSDRDPLALSDAALRLAGHDVTDEYVRQLGREVAAGTLSADEAIARVRRASLK